MSQHDFSIANATGAAVRADINDALAALATLSSGSTAPSSPIAYQFWMDTANSVLYQRNSGNSGWVIRAGAQDSPSVNTKTSAFTITRNEMGRVIPLGGSSYSISLTAAATLGEGFWCWLYARTPTGIITIDPNGAETINGSSTETMRIGQAAMLYCTGSGFHLLGNGSIHGTYSPFVDGFIGGSSGSYTIDGRRVNVEITLILYSQDTTGGSISLPASPFADSVATILDVASMTARHGHISSGSGVLLMPSATLNGTQTIQASYMRA